MSKTVILTAVAAALGLTAFQASAELPYPPRMNDETDQRWVYRAPGSGTIPERAPAASSKAWVERGDEGDQAWVYQRPGAGPRTRAPSDASVGAPRPGYREHGDENDLRWFEEHTRPSKR